MKIKLKELPKTFKRVGFIKSLYYENAGIEFNRNERD
jgi:hypothetical protein